MASTNALKKKVALSLKKGRIAEAGKYYVLICQQNPKDIESLYELGEIKIKQGLYSDAVKIFRNIIQINPQYDAAYGGLGEACFRLRSLDEGRRYCEQALKLNSGQTKAGFTLANIFREQNAFDAAEQYYSLVVRLDPTYAHAHYYLGNMHKTQGRVCDAINDYSNAIELDASLSEAIWNKNKLLPVIVTDPEQILESRERYEQGLEYLEDNLQLDTATGRRNALRGLLTSTNFYLQYQGCDDLKLQRKYAHLLSEVMTANYPKWSKPIEKKPYNAGEKIRIGYVSAFLRAHNGAVWLLGWLANRNHADFEIYCYHTGVQADEKTEEFERLSDSFHHIHGDIDKLCKTIVSDQLHILVYPELGMDPQSMATAGLKLAPVQCVGWGHPITSGLTTMDYWLSSDLMEPENGQQHYSEKLIRLPNLANCHSKAQHDRMQSAPLSKTRSDFGLPKDAILYFCSQSLFKYLPQYDYLWPEIAKQVPNAKFVFLAISSVHVLKKFMARIEIAFNRYDMKAQDYCIMLNRQPPEEYLILNKLVDVFLDNPPWSGNNTSMAAIDAHLPIVSYPTEFMRGRHSYAILSMLGLQETIAKNTEEYIEIAAKLGNDKVYRQKIVQKIADQHERIYDDKECVY